jgi:hypothetical protein
MRCGTNNAQVHLFMKAYTFLFIFGFFLFGAGKNFAGAKIDSAAQYLFVEWQHWDSTLVLGHFSKNQLKRIPEISCRLNEMNEEKINKWLKNSGSAALLSFHCMWGQQTWFHRKKYLSSFGDIIQSAGNANIKTVISFIWHSGGINYKKNWDGAFAKGQPLAKFFLLVNYYYANNTYIVCHSMGSRFFEGIISSISNEQVICKTIVLFSADLPASTRDQHFNQLQTKTNAIAVFQHKRDKLLLLSSIVYNNKRLGRSGPLPMQNGITLFDMTGHIKGLQNHAHLNKTWAKQKMIEFLNSVL